MADEEKHIDWLETQLELMDKLGEPLYAAQCVSRPPSWLGGAGRAAMLGRASLLTSGCVAPSPEK